MVIDTSFTRFAAFRRVAFGVFRQGIFNFQCRPRYRRSGRCIRDHVRPRNINIARHIRRNRRHYTGSRINGPINNNKTNSTGVTTFRQLGFKTRCPGRQANARNGASGGRRRRNSNRVLHQQEIGASVRRYARCTRTDDRRRRTRH